MIKAVVEPMGYEFVGLEFLGRHDAGRLLRVYIDAPAGIRLDDCAQVSHQLSGLLDVEDPIAGEYSLEVSSPGLDRPLFELAHFERFKGREVNVRLAKVVAGRRRYKGVIKGISGHDIELRVEGQDVVVDFGQIENANLVPDLEREQYIR
jgi:ribosome maturation factor RimP